MDEVWKWKRCMGKHEMTIFPYVIEKVKKLEDLKYWSISILAIIVGQWMLRRRGANSPKSIDN